MEYDLEKRTIKFAKDIVKFAQEVRKNVINLPLISQLVRAGTSVGANYHEANGASSRRDFKNKIYICKKEIKETKYWLDIIVDANVELENKVSELRKEAQELTLIFSKIISTLRK